jgi:DNA-binding CsgD family transcriptional regulator
MENLYMALSNNQHDTSHELQIYKYSNGVKLKRPEKEYNQQDHLPTFGKSSVLNVLQLPCNVYFLDQDSVVRNANELSAKNCCENSLDYLIGKSVRNFSSEKEVENILRHDLEIMETKKLIVVDEELRNRRGLSIKLPWYDHENNIIGVFGFTIVLENQSLATSLANIAMLGFLSPTVPNQILADRFEIENIRLSKRETDIARLIVYKKTAKEAAKILGLSYRTVESYIENIKVKTNAYSKSELLDKIIMHQKSLLR